MATQFYRAIFGEGDTSLKLGGDAKKMFDTTHRHAADRQRARFAGARGHA